ncbi:MAG: DNA primase [Flavobacteriales bacterium]|nr:DNA primase [Flavobacteriales bacterium]
MIDPKAIQDVKDATRIEDVVGEFVSLKRKGPRYLGLCPFHNEKTPSFNVSPALGIFKCFGCGESGDAITFLQKHEHLSYVESIRWLAKRYSIELPEEERTPEQQMEQSERESLAVIQTWAAEWSMDQLWNADEGRRIGLGYFHERGFRDETIRQFQLGYVPERGDAFAQAAIAHGFLPDLLEKAGWIKRREDGTPWDFFQGRVTFPVHGLSGQVIAFGARTLKSDKKLPKYFNSPESVLYVKSRSLYGIWHARKAMAEAGTCYLVEGYTDVISLHQAGVVNVVASSGTSLTEEQVRLIKRYCSSVTILYDGDPAGIKASLRGIDLILAEGLNVKVVLFPEGEDPDSFARSRPSHEVLAFLQQEARDFLVFKADLLMRDVGDDPVRKAEVVHSIVESIAAVGDMVLRSLYTQQCSRLLGVPEQALVSELNKVLRRAYKRKLGKEEEMPEASPAAQVVPPQPPEPPGTRAQELELLRLIVRYGEVQVGHVTASIVEGAESTPITVGEMIFASLEEDNAKISDPRVESALSMDRSIFTADPKTRLMHFLEHPDAELRKLVMGLVEEHHALNDWQRHKIHVVHERDRLYETVQRALVRYKERYVDKAMEDMLEHIRDADEDAQLKLMAMKRQLEQYRSALSQRSGRVTVG